MDEYKFYDQGWNDFVDGKEWPGSANSTEDYRDGWHDCRDATQAAGGVKPEKI